MPKHPLQSRIFAVNCIYQKDGGPVKAAVREDGKVDPMRISEEYGMLEMLLGTGRRQCAMEVQGIRVTSCGITLQKLQDQKAVV